MQARNVTQTSVTLSWSPLQLATSKLRSLDIYRNAQRLASIPSPLTNTSTKLSGLELDTPYTFQLVLRTTAGTFPSNTLQLTTHTTSNTSGVVVCFGPIGDAERAEEVKRALGEMGGRWSEKIEIDTSHYVCDTPRLADGMMPPVGSDAPGANGSSGGGGVAKAVAGYKQVLGVEYQRALQLSIPTVQPSWVMECWAQKRSVFAIHLLYSAFRFLLTLLFRLRLYLAFIGWSPSQDTTSAHNHPRPHPPRHSQATRPRHSPSHTSTSTSTTTNKIPAPTRTRVRLLQTYRKVLLRVREEEQALGRSRTDSLCPSCRRTTTEVETRVRS